MPGSKPTEHPMNSSPKCGFGRTRRVPAKDAAPRQSARSSLPWRGVPTARRRLNRNVPSARTRERTTSFATACGQPCARLKRIVSTPPAAARVSFPLSAKPGGFASAIRSETSDASVRKKAPDGRGPSRRTRGIGVAGRWMAHARERACDARPGARRGKLGLRCPSLSPRKLRRPDTEPSAATRPSSAHTVC